MSTKKILIKPSRKKGESKAEIVLNDDLTIYTIEEVKDKIFETINKYEVIHINGTQVKNMDLSFIQLLNSVQKLAKNKSISLDFELNNEAKELFDNTDVTRIIKNK